MNYILKEKLSNAISFFFMYYDALILKVLSPTLAVATAAIIENESSVLVL